MFRAETSKCHQSMSVTMDGAVGFGHPFLASGTGGGQQFMARRG